jgi:putative ABC transport system permease protein
MERLALEYPETNRGRGIRVVAVREQIAGNLRPVLIALLAAVSLLLLIACSNVTSLLLARSLGRSTELSVRAALGASRGRLLRQLLAESILAAVPGAAFGLVLANAGVRALITAIPFGAMDGLGFLRDIRPHAGMTLFTLLLALAAGLGSGLLAGWSGTRVRSRSGSLQATGLRATAGVSRARIRDLLVAGQLSFTVVLLAGAILVGRSLVRLVNDNPGFRPEQVLTARVPLSGPSYSDPVTHIRFFESLLDGIRSLPGVLEVGAITNLPASGGSTLTYRVEGQPEPDPAARPEVVQRGVAGNYFRAMGIPLIAGRTFTQRDDSSGQPVIMINEALAKRHFPGGNALGQRFRFYAAPAQAWEIVGVVGDVKTGRLDALPPATIYYSHLQVAENRMALVLRTTGDPLSLVPAIRAQVNRLDPDVPVYGVSTMEEVVANSAAVFARRYPMVLIGAFAAAALVLALAGVYGMMSWSVTQRRRELGIRSALGASPGRLLTDVLAESAKISLLGLAPGCLMAFVFARTLSSTLYGVAPTDFVTYLAVAGVLGLATLLASAWPARRAAASDPVQTLRSD